jgi:hypothetical protein
MGQKPKSYASGIETSTYFLCFVIYFFVTYSTYFLYSNVKYYNI